LLRDDVFRDDVLRAVARPPRAPAVRTDIVPRPLVVLADDVRADDFFAVARPPFAPAFFFCAVVPARPPFAPAAFTDVVPRPLVLRAVVDAFFRGVADVLRDVLELFLRDTLLVFFREDVPPPRDAVEVREELEPELREEPELFDDDFVSPDSDRCLLTVRAAISFARFVERPCFCSESLMCSYCRSRFALHDWGMCNLLGGLPAGKHMPTKRAVHARMFDEARRPSATRAARSARCARWRTARSAGRPSPYLRCTPR
jgi:hypothetical protein